MRPAFDRRAGRYDKHAGVQREAAAWLAEWLPAPLDGPALELGAGTGLFTAHLLPHTGRLTATDLAPRMVETGRLAYPGAAWSVADAGAPPRTAPWAWMFSCSLVQWLADPALAFRRWHQAMAPHGRLLAGWFIRGTLEDFFHHSPTASPFSWRDENEWLDLLRTAGWTIERAQTRVFHRRHPTSLAMLRDIHNIGATVPGRFGPGRLREALRRHDRLHGDAQGIETNFVFLRIEASQA